MAHTPGPWKARPVPNVGLKGPTGYAIDYNDAQEQVVDFVYEEADAQLIAAAPQLLMALRDAIEILQPLAEQIPSVRSRREAYERIVSLATGAA